MTRILTRVVWVVLVLTAAAGVAQAQVPPGAGPQFMLTGVVVVEGGGRAWLQEPQLTQDQTVSLRPGESIGPYRLMKVYEDRVELIGPTGGITVPLAGLAAPGPIAKPVTPPPPPAAPPTPAPTTGPDRVVVLPPGPPLAPLPPNTPRVDFGTLLRGEGFPR
jgi:hypothetical protein